MRPISGLVTNDDSGYIPPDALSKARGAKLVPDSPIVYKQGGRVAFNGRVPGSGASSLTVADFNSVNDLFLLKQNGNLYTAPVGLNGTFAALLEQKQAAADADVSFTRTASTTPLLGVKFGDAFLAVDGEGRPFVIESNGRTRLCGLLTPKGTMTFANPGAGTDRIKPLAHTIVTGGSAATIENADLAYDTVANSIDTHATYSLNGPGNGGAVFDWTGAVGFPTAGNFLQIIYAGSAARRDVDEDPIRRAEPAVFQMQVAISVDAGVTWETLTSLSVVSSRANYLYTLDDGITASNFRVRILITNNVSSSSGSASLEIYDVAVVDDAALAQYSTANEGIRYGYCEVFSYELTLPDGNVITQKVRSSLSPLSPREDGPALGAPGEPAASDMQGWWGNKITLPTVAANAATNEIEIYRTTDAGSEAGTKAIDGMTRLVTLPWGTTTWTDKFDEDGHPLDWQVITDAPPFIKHLGTLLDANAPPPAGCDVVGEFLSYALFATDDFPGQFWWSRPGHFDYVPSHYTHYVRGTVRAFADVGTCLVLSDEEVVSYAYLPDASDAQFLPNRQRRVVSPGRGCLSRRGTVVLTMPGHAPICIFIAPDGLWWANPALAAPWSPMLNWPVTVDTASLSTAELHHNAATREVFMAYTDPDGKRMGLHFYYGRGTTIPTVMGPYRIPADAAAVARLSGIDTLFTAQNGRVYREDVGTLDVADLEENNGYVTLELEGRQEYFAPPYLRERAYLRTFSVYTLEEPGASLALTVTPRIDDNAPQQPVRKSFDLSNPGWKTRAVDRQCQSFKWNLTTTGPMPGLCDIVWDAKARSKVKGEGKIS